jgi:hypothetical protein
MESPEIDSEIPPFCYRKSHVIHFAAGAGTLYQKRITVHLGSGTDSGADVYLNFHSRSDFGDVRFTDDDGFTFLNYWIEWIPYADYAYFWVQVADDLSLVDQTIYIYYGDPAATTTSNFGNTFPIYNQDFQNDTEGLPPSKFLETTYLEVGYPKILIITNSPCDNRMDVSDMSSLSLHGTVDGNHIGGYDQQGICLRRTNANNKILVGHISGFDTFEIYEVIGGVYYLRATTGFTYGVPTGDPWCHMSVDVSGNNIIASIWNINGSATISYGSLSITSSGKTSLIALRYIWSFWDNFFICKYVYPEPEHGAWGIEENFCSP